MVAFVESLYGYRLYPVTHFYGHTFNNTPVYCLSAWRFSTEKAYINGKIIACSIWAVLL